MIAISIFSLVFLISLKLLENAFSGPWKKQECLSLNAYFIFIIMLGQQFVIKKITENQFDFIKLVVSGKNNISISISNL